MGLRLYLGLLFLSNRGIPVATPTVTWSESLSTYRALELLESAHLCALAEVLTRKHLEALAPCSGLSYRMEHAASGLRYEAVQLVARACWEVGIDSPAAQEVHDDQP